MALSKQESTRDTTNLARIARIILCPCTKILQNVLEQQITPFELKWRCHHILWKTSIKNPCFHILECFIDEFDGNYANLNIPMLYFFLRFICDIPSPNTKWEYFRSEEDRSLSANIERIYIIQKKYIAFSDDSFEDSFFEQEWGNIFQIVKELEEDIGSDTVNQDAMKKLQNCSMEPDIENLLIRKLRGEDLIRNLINLKNIHN